MYWVDLGESFQMSIYCSLFSTSSLSQINLDTTENGPSEIWPAEDTEILQEDTGILGPSPLNKQHWQLSLESLDYLHCMTILRGQRDAMYDFAAQKTVAAGRRVL